MSKTVSLILARKGDENQSIPFKNLRKIHGKPMISYVIEQSIISREIDETWVSSNCDETLKLAKKIGARTIKRPDEISGPSAHNEWAMLHFAKEHDFDNIVCIQPTSPLLLSWHLDEALRTFKDQEGIDSVFSANDSKWTPHWERVSTPDNSGADLVPMDWDIDSRPMRQDTVRAFEENGAFYITTKKALQESKNRYSGNIKCYLMPKSYSIQVDDMEDLYLVEAMLYHRAREYNLDFFEEMPLHDDDESFMTEELKKELMALDSEATKEKIAK